MKNVHVADKKASTSFFKTAKQGCVSTYQYSTIQTEKQKSIDLCFTQYDSAKNIFNT